MGFPGDLVAVLVDTFGVFLLPTAVFALGIALYVVLWVLERWRGGHE